MAGDNPGVPVAAVVVVDVELHGHVALCVTAGGGERGEGGGGRRLGREVPHGFLCVAEKSWLVSK